MSDPQLNQHLSKIVEIDHPPRSSDIPTISQ
uniref:Uncharacterized protein n=1 Tax=viral metagenome TaxID=1070528 RepID=A0A6C0BLJ8_9ZZZZ